MAKKKETFSLAASDKPKEAETPFELSDPNAVQDCPLTLSFSSPVHKIYSNNPPAEPAALGSPLEEGCKLKFSSA
jgi:hypothetical protein